MMSSFFNLTVQIPETFSLQLICDNKQLFLTVEKLEYLGFCSKDNYVIIMIAALMSLQCFTPIFSTHESSWRNISKGKSMCKLQDASETFYRPNAQLHLCLDTQIKREYPSVVDSLSCPLCVFDSSLSATPSLQISLSSALARWLMSGTQTERERVMGRKMRNWGKWSRCQEHWCPCKRQRGSFSQGVHSHTLVTHWYYASEEETQEQLMWCQQQWLDVLIQDDSG